MRGVCTRTFLAVVVSMRGRIAAHRVLKNQPALLYNILFQLEEDKRELCTYRTWISPTSSG